MAPFLLFQPGKLFFHALPKGRLVLYNARQFHLNLLWPFLPLRNYPDNHPQLLRTRFAIRRHYRHESQL